MASVPARLLRAFARARIKTTPVDYRYVRELRLRMGGAIVPTLVSRQVGLRPARPDELGGVGGEWVGVPGATRTVLYVHGGAYVGGDTRTYRNLAGRLAVRLGADVALVDYRLAPEHPYPAALDDAVAAYRALLDAGVDPARTAIGGDSAGGGLALATLLRAREEGLPLPAAAVLISPWTDLTCSGASVEANGEADAMLTGAMGRAGAARYGAGAELTDPGLSPLFGDLAGLPPILVTVDESEILLSDAERLVERIESAAGRVELLRGRGLLHVWPVFVPFLPEALATVRRLGDFLDAELEALEAA